MKTWWRLAAVAQILIALQVARADSIDRSVVPGGGTVGSTTGTYTLNGAAGQTTGDTVSGGGYALTGGFWPRPTLAVPPDAGSPDAGGGTPDAGLPDAGASDGGATSTPPSGCGCHAGPLSSMSALWVSAALLLRRRRRSA